MGGKGISNLEIKKSSKIIVILTISLILLVFLLPMKSIIL